MKLTTLFLIGCSSVALAQLPPHPVPQVTRNGDTCNLDWTGQNSITYFVQYSLDLQSWSYMPVIESGDGSAIGYGFQCDTDKMFVRLHYTDTPTSNTNSDDFDGDGISNWDEVRVGGTGTSPLITDTDGDGQIDYFNDGDNNDLADAWELQYFNSIGTADANVDTDGDGLSNREESLMGSDPTKKDTDGDLVNDNEESIWWDNDIKWPRSKEIQYAVIELNGINLTATNYESDLLKFDRNLQLFQPGDLYEEPASDWSIISLSNAGHVLLQEDLRHPSEIEDDGQGVVYNTGLLVPSNIADSMRNYVWSPDTASWNKLNSDELDGGQTALAVGASVSASGEVIGYAWVPLKDNQGNPTQVEKTIVRWIDVVAGEKAAPTTPLSNLGITNPTFTTSQSSAGATQDYPALYLTEDGNLLNMPSSFDFSTRNGDTFTYNSGTGEVTFKVDNTGSGDVIADGAEKSTSVRAAARIKHNDLPTNVDIAALSNGMWARRHFVWKKIQPHPTNPVTGGIGVSEDFTVLLGDGKTIMRNGKTLAISTLVPSTIWNNFRMEKMNDRGVMAGRASRGGQEKIVLLVPVEILQPELNAAGGIVQEGGSDKFIPVDAIRPSRWENAWVWNNQFSIYEFDENFVESDPDRFRISTPMAWQAFDSKWMKLLASGAAAATQLNFEEIDDNGKKTFQSKDLILVLDGPDDAISFNPDLGVDDADDDLTHRIMDDELPLDSDIGLLVPASIGGALDIQWLRPKIKQFTHDLEVDLVVLVTEQDEFNFGHHSFYEDRVKTYIEWARSSYGRIGIDFKSSFSVQVVSDSVWNTYFGTGELNSADAPDLLDIIASGNPNKPVMYLTSFQLMGSSRLNGFAFANSNHDSYGYGFVSLAGASSDLNPVTLAHEVGHILGYLAHANSKMQHNVMVSGTVQKFANQFDDSKRFSLGQEAIFKVSEFVKKK